MDLIELLDKVRTCSDCKGTGKVLYRGRVVDHTCLREVSYQYRLATANIPVRFQSLEFKDYIYQSSGTFQKAKTYIWEHEKARSRGTGLYLYGPAKAGQTPLAVSIVKELLKLNYTAHFTTYSAMLSDLVDSIQDHPRYGQGVDFLCIDGVTEVLDNLVNFRPAFITGENVNFAVTYLEKILSQRMYAKLPCILTARASINQINEKFSSLGLILLGNTLQVECIAEDFRGEKLQNKLMEDFAFDKL